MSTFSDTSHSHHAVRGLLKGAAAALAGRPRGRDHAEGRRVPRRNSYEENDSRAKPWRPIGDGSVAQGIVHREALIDTADELRRQLRSEYPGREIRRRRRDRETLARELADLMTWSPADVPVGRLATLRIAIEKHDTWLATAGDCLRRIDVDILRALLSFVDFATGRLFPDQETIAARAGCHKNSVVDALKRLRLHGLVDWVRRTVRTGNDGAFAPQLEQTSNAYTLAVRRRMAPRTWQRYWQRLCAKLRRLGAIPAAIVPSAPREVQDTPLRQALAALSSKLDNAST